jgi:hypothetical protein
MPFIVIEDKALCPVDADLFNDVGIVLAPPRNSTGAALDHQGAPARLPFGVSVDYTEATGIGQSTWVNSACYQLQYKISNSAGVK